MLSLRRDGLLRFARNDGSTPELSLLFEIRVPSLRGAKRRSNPCSLCGEMDCFASLAMTAQRLNCLCCLKLECRHCEKRSDEAIHSFFTRRDGLLRFARNDGSTPGLSVAVWNQEAVIARSEATKQSILSLRGEMDCFASLAMTAQHLDCLWLFGIRKPSLRGAKRRSNPFFLYAARWIASLRSQ